MDHTYHNPVYPHSCPDPFVLKYCGEYWGYFTGFTPDGRCFGIVHSRDLVTWRFVGAALEPLPGGWPCYWAPEVTYHNGRFYLYYSVGNEEQMELRVAVATHPAGPFVDSGYRLTSEPFAIDAHVAIDDDGSWHLFYATDYLDHSHVGTGTARARLHDPFTLAEQPRPVTRPRYDWHVYDPQRVAKGGVRWHTVEGPFVLHHKGRYYQMFSGGNWQNHSYGVSYATSERIDPADEWAQMADGAATLPILRTIPGEVIGPGHNSVVRGPDNRQLFCIYHRWDQATDARVLAIDPLDWAGERLIVLGPSTGPRPVPITPLIADFFDGESNGLGPHWACADGDWGTQEGAYQRDGSALMATARLQNTPPAYLAEVSLRALDGEATGGYGISLGNDLLYLIERAEGGSWQVAVETQRADGDIDRDELPLPADFDPCAVHLIRAEVDKGRASISLDSLYGKWSGPLAAGASGAFTLRTAGMAACFSGFALTEGWEEWFNDEEAQPADQGWRVEAGRWDLADGLLRQQDAHGAGVIIKGPPLGECELVINLRLDNGAPGGACGFAPAYSGPDSLRVMLEREGEGWALTWTGAEPGRVPLPPTFDGTRFEQLRCRKEGAQLAIFWEDQPLATVPIDQQPAPVALLTRNAVASYDLVRATARGER